ncbi:uncharacterized protein LOC120802782 [Xiphias gladius]|uniref:uncharacterized protein LOC120802782 n=1 Tax=Xiphias gladius TaxID=8245 RepID=UPI001A98F5DD|nr:uncharacterized protein LOC120802782 [Xiphias gladius]XP_040006867.1 uncharacterized protein LOC120802782 [Xiphias gladius]
MSGLLLLMYCIEILGAQLCEAQGSKEIAMGDTTPTGQESLLPTIQDNSSASPAHLASASMGVSEASSLMNTETITALYSTLPAPAPKYPMTPTTTTTVPNRLFYREECLTVFMVSGGLIIGCSILLISTLLLTWKVWQLSRRLKMLSNNADMISNSEYWMGTAKKHKSNSETEAKETSILMADFSQTQEDGGTTKEEGGKVERDGQMGEENKKGVGDTANREETSAGENKKETPVTVAENSSSSKQQEDTADSQSTKAVGASSTEGTEEPLDVV